MSEVPKVENELKEIVIKSTLNYADEDNFVTWVNGTTELNDQNLNKLSTLLRYLFHAQSTDTAPLLTQIIDRIDALVKHNNSAENPHNVTKAQVGLGNVDNTSVDGIKAEFTGKIEDNNQGFVLGKDVYGVQNNLVNGISTINSKIGNGFDSENTISAKTTTLTEAIDEHTKNQNNPHNVKASQVAADRNNNVQNALDIIETQFNSDISHVTADINTINLTIGSEFNATKSISTKTTELTKAIDELSERVTDVENATSPEKAVTTEDELVIYCGSSTYMIE